MGDLYDKDASYVREFLKNDSQWACRALVERHQSAVFRTCISIVKDPIIAEELAQDCFIKAFKNLKSLNNPRTFQSWILTTAYRTSIDYIRKKRENNLHFDERYQGIDESNRPDKKIEIEEQQQLVMEWIHDLGEPDSTLFILFYFEDVGVKQISDILNLSVSNVKIKLMRGRKALKKKIEEQTNWK